jgi:hypothetical protein
MRGKLIRFFNNIPEPANNKVELRTNLNGRASFIQLALRRIE